MVPVLPPLLNRYFSVWVKLEDARFVLIVKAVPSVGELVLHDGEDARAMVGGV